MIYRIVADVIVAIHFAYVSFVVLGLLATLVGWALDWQWIRNRWFRGIHLTMIAIVVFESWAGITCPLTTLENEFRGAAGQKTYGGDFVAHWLHDAMFIHATPWMFTIVYSVFGALVLLTLFYVPPRWRGKSSDLPAVAQESKLSVAQESKLSVAQESESLDAQDSKSSGTSDSD